jgi:hypothetical protein
MIASDGGNRRYVALVGRFTLNSATPVANYQKTPNSDVNRLDLHISLRIFYDPRTIGVQVDTPPTKLEENNSLLWQIAIGSTTSIH